jgi:serine/threonine-protein kinase
MRLEAGALIDGRYEVRSALGQGGMNEVYKAEDRETGAPVVVKIPYANLLGDPALFDRYQRELEIDRRLDHPNIQRLLAAGRLSGGPVPFMVLEYVDGQLLREYLRERGRLPVAEAVGVALQLARALQYCHEQGVVHRDLKPENVLITPDGQVKLFDFGIARLRGARRLTFGRFSATVGTPDYMAPEQVRGERGDARTDLYALGVMLYEMLAGEVPFPGESALAVMNRRVKQEPPLVRRQRPDVPPGLEAAIFRALRRDPDRRYASLAEFRHDLEHPEEVPIPDYAQEVFPRRPYGAMPSPLKVIGLLLAVFASLAALGLLAELAHRSQAAP